MDKIKNERYAHCLTNAIQPLTPKLTWGQKIKIGKKTQKYAGGAEKIIITQEVSKHLQQLC